MASYRLASSFTLISAQVLIGGLIVRTFLSQDVKHFDEESHHDLVLLAKLCKRYI